MGHYTNDINTSAANFQTQFRKNKIVKTIRNYTGNVHRTKVGQRISTAHFHAKKEAEQRIGIAHLGEFRTIAN